MTLTAKQNEFLRKISALAVEDGRKSGVLPSLTIAQAIVESEWGASDLAVKANNFFGMKKSGVWKGETYFAQSPEFIGGIWLDPTSEFEKFPDMAACVAEHSATVNRVGVYKPVRFETDYKKACYAIFAGGKGWATDPKYPEKLIKAIDACNLTQYDNVERNGNMSKFTNTGLAQQAKRALNEQWFYGWGAFGQKATNALIDSLCKQYPNNEKWRSYMSGAVGKTRLCDCYGLVKSLLFWDMATDAPKYNALYDVNSDTAYNRAKEKGDISSMPEIPGLVLHMGGHVGVYTGGGEFVEIAGGVGARKGLISGGKVTVGSKFAHWFKDVNIAYDTTPVPAAKTDITPVQMLNALMGGAALNTPQYWRDRLNDVKYFDGFVTAIYNKYEGGR